MPATGDAVNVKVALRCRPLSKKELSEGDRSIFTKDGNVARLQDPDGRQNGGQPIEFGFDILRRQLATQEPHQHVRARWWSVAEERWREGLHDEQVLSHLRTGEADL